jgi:hypothetical protein
MHRPLLLAAREVERRAVEPVAHLVPEGGLVEAPLDDLAERDGVLHAVDPWAEGDVVVDRLRERVALLEDHADAPAEQHGIDVGCVDVRAVERHLAVDAGRRGSCRSCG